MAKRFGTTQRIPPCSNTISDHKVAYRSDKRALTMLMSGRQVYSICSHVTQLSLRKSCHHVGVKTTTVRAIFFYLRERWKWWPTISLFLLQCCQIKSTTSTLDTKIDTERNCTFLACSMTIFDASQELPDLEVRRYLLLFDWQLFGVHNWNDESLQEPRGVQMFCFWICGSPGIVLNRQHRQCSCKV